MKQNIHTYLILFLIGNCTVIPLHGQNVLKIQAGTVLSTTNAAIVTLNNMDLENNGIFNQAAGDGMVVFNGAGNNIISGTSSSLFDVLQLAKTGNAKLTLEQEIQVGSSIDFTGGILDLNAQNILLLSTAVLNNESESSHIIGTNGGYVQISRPLTAPSKANPGNLGAVINSTEDLGMVIIRRGHQSQQNRFGIGKTILRYYDIIPANNTALNATLQLNYLDAALNGLNENALSVWASSDTLHWTNLGFTDRRPMENVVEQEKINGLYRFTLTEVGNALPLKWGSFNTQCVGGQTQISWKTLQEQNTTAFIVRRSTDGSAWTTIANLPAAGNSQNTLSYSYTDPQSLTETAYYQVYEQDFDGRQTFSPVLSSQCSQGESIKVYPLPTQGNCWVSIQAERKNTVILYLYNSLGALLRKQVVTLMPGNNVFELSLANYAKGIYSLVITGGDGKVNVIKVEKI